MKTTVEITNKDAITLAMLVEKEIKRVKEYMTDEADEQYLKNLKRLFKTLN